MERQRTRIKKRREPSIDLPSSPPTAILISDLHGRTKQPRSRTDSYWEAFKKKMTFLRELQNSLSEKEGILPPILCGGDVLDSWNVPHEVITWMLTNLPSNFYAVLGQHDIRSHNLNTLSQSAIASLVAINAIRILNNTTPTKLIGGDGSSFNVLGASWGEDIPEGKDLNNTDPLQVIVTHKTIIDEREPFEGVEAHSLLRRYSEYDLILSGDNHKPFVIKGDKGLLVNPGSFMRLSADQESHRPRIYLWYSATNEAKPIYLPIEPGVIIREFAESSARREERFEELIGILETEFELGLDFEKNLEAYFKTNRTRKAVQDLVWEMVNEDGDE